MSLGSGMKWFGGLDILTLTDPQFVRRLIAFELGHRISDLTTVGEWLLVSL